ncbi:MAG: FtsX-like permease family protein [Chlorobiaceae bacterium]|nr:FtsX-like permease family protein [Chlorobiaceae bacterium]NTV17580.1 FtsX-like permease family protein [Chlorobiaceae bacterium]
MLLRETVIQAIYSLTVNKLRSWLTIMGVAVGVFSIIAVMTALDAIDKSVETGLTSLGANTFQIQKNPATVFGSGHSRNFYANRKDISYKQALLFRKSMETSARNIGFTITSPANLAKYANRTTNPDVALSGGDENFSASNGYAIASGRNLSESDIRSARNAAVIGSELSETLFPSGESPLNKFIKVNGEVYTVCGVFEKKGAAFGQSQDNFVLIPITRYLDHINEKSSLSITVEALSRKEYQATIDRAIGAMRLARGLTVKDINDFEIRTNESLIDSFRDIKRAISTGAFIISFMALLTAGVGIMNIMLVSVTERTKEIGIRKSIGAPRTTILRQFLFEALFLSIAGGLIGVIVGIAAGNVVALKFNLPPIFPLLWITVSMVVCSTIGMAFGLFPAWKAANLNPVEALRPK